MTPSEISTLTTPAAASGATGPFSTHAGGPGLGAGAYAGIGAAGGIGLVLLLAGAFKFVFRNKNRAPANDLLDGKTIENFTKAAARLPDGARRGLADKATWLGRVTRLHLPGGQFPDEVLSQEEWHGRTKAFVEHSVDMMYVLQRDPLHTRSVFAKISEELAPTAAFQTNPSTNVRMGLIGLGEPGADNPQVLLDHLRACFDEIENIGQVLSVYQVADGTIDEAAQLNRRQKLTTELQKARDRLSAIEVEYPDGKASKYLNATLQGPLLTLANFQIALANTLLQFATLLPIIVNGTGNVMIEAGLYNDTTATKEDISNFRKDRQSPWYIPNVIWLFFGILPFYMKLMADSRGGSPGIDDYAEWSYKAQANVGDDGQPRSALHPNPWYAALLTITALAAGYLYMLEFKFDEPVKKWLRKGTDNEDDRVAREGTYFPPATDLETTAASADPTGRAAATSDLRRFLRTFQEATIALAGLNAAAKTGSHADSRGTAQVGWLLQRQIRGINVSFTTIAGIFEECGVVIVDIMPDVAKMTADRMKEHRPRADDPPDGQELVFNDSALNTTLGVLTVLESLGQIVASAVNNPGALSDFVVYFPIALWEQFKTFSGVDNEEKMDVYANLFLVATLLLIPNFAKLGYYISQKRNNNPDNDLFNLTPRPPANDGNSPANETAATDSEDSLRLIVTKMVADTMEIGQRMTEEFKAIDAKNGTGTETAIDAETATTAETSNAPEPTADEILKGIYDMVDRSIADKAPQASPQPGSTPDASSDMGGLYGLASAADNSSGGTGGSIDIEKLIGYAPFQQPGAQIPNLQAGAWAFTTTVLVLATICAGTKFGPGLTWASWKTFSRGFKAAAPEEARSSERSVTMFNKAMRAMVRASTEAQRQPGNGSEDEGGIQMQPTNNARQGEQFAAEVREFETNHLRIADLPSEDSARRQQIRDDLVRFLTPRPSNLIADGSINPLLAAEFATEVERLAIPEIVDSSTPAHRMMTQIRNFESAEWPAVQQQVVAETSDSTRRKLIRDRMMGYLEENARNLVGEDGDVSSHLRQLFAGEIDRLLAISATSSSGE